MATSDPQGDSVDPKLSELLVCPRTHDQLTFNATRTELISAKQKLAFPIRDGIPIMRLEEARPISDDEARNIK
jgi:uncharacterized protein YbaR (Trm112 family)